MTTNQLAAMRNLQLRIQKIYEETRAANALIDQHNLEAEFGILRLPYYSMGATIGTIADAHRINSMVGELERMVA